MDPSPPAKCWRRPDDFNPDAGLLLNQIRIIAADMLDGIGMDVQGWAWEMTMEGKYIAHGVRMGTKREVIEYLASTVDRLNNPPGLTSHAGIYK